MTTVTIWHNPRCSKSRQTLALLQEQGVEPTVFEYLKTPLTVDQVTEVLQKLGLTPRELLRTGEAIYKELGLRSGDFTDQQVIEAMVEHPKLIERPIVINGEQAALGRPPENVLAIL